MARRYYLASVGNAEGFVKKQNELQHVLSSRTLTESTLGFTSTQEEVRAGQGAKLYGRFNHTAGMTVTLTDAMFDMNYIALQTGSDISLGGSAIHSGESFVAAADAQQTVTLENEPVALGKACGLDKICVWFRPAGCNPSQNDISIEVDGTTNTYAAGTLTIGGADAKKFVSGTTYCVSYFANENLAKFMQIAANFVPAEMVLILTAKLYEGDANAPESGKPAGEITIKVPRFQLDGQFDLSMAMASAATMQLSGTALAVDAGGCNDEGIYAEVVQVIQGETYTSAGIVELAVDPDSAKANETPIVFGYTDGQSDSVLIPNTDLTFDPALTSDRFAASQTYTISLKENAAIKVTQAIS